MGACCCNKRASSQGTVVEALSPAANGIGHPAAARTEPTTKPCEADVAGGAAVGGGPPAEQVDAPVMGLTRDGHAASTSVFERLHQDAAQRQSRKDRQSSSSSPVPRADRAAGGPAAIGKGRGKGEPRDVGTPPRKPSSAGGPGGAPAQASAPKRRSVGGSKGPGAGAPQTGRPQPPPDLDEHEKALMNEVLEDAPGVAWDTIVGLEDVKRMFWEIIIAPAKNPALFSGIRKPPKGVLLFGPPGNGKTMLAKAVATECESTFFSISASSLVSKWVGESEKQMRALFSLARKMQPSVVFIDEVDSILTSRSAGEHESARRLKTEFLVQLDGAATPGASGGAGGADAAVDRILVLGATNRPMELDEAVLRRLPRRILIPLPDLAARKALVQKSISAASQSLSEKEFTKLASSTQGYSCSDLAALSREAAMGPIRSLPQDKLVSATPETVRAISMADFDAALKVIRPSVTKEALKSLEEWNRQYGST